MAKPYHHGDLKRAIMEDALLQLAEGESVPLNFRQLGKRLGVSHAAIYRHFENKQALIDALAENGFWLLNGRFTAALSTAPATTAARLRLLAHTYVTFALEQPVLMRVMFSGISTDRKALSSLKKESKAALEALTAIVGAAHDRGELIDDDPLSTTLFFWSALHGLAELLRNRQLANMVSPEQIDSLIEVTVRNLLFGTVRKSS